MKVTLTINGTMYGDTANIYCICGVCMAWIWTSKQWHTTNDGIKNYNVDKNEGYCARIGQ